MLVLPYTLISSLHGKSELNIFLELYSLDCQTWFEYSTNSKTHEFGYFEREEGKDGFKIHEEVSEKGNILPIVPNKQEQSPYEEKEP